MFIYDKKNHFIKKIVFMKENVLNNFLLRFFYVSL